MLADLTAIREHLLSHNTPEQLAGARQRLGWYTRKVIDRVTAPCVDVAIPIQRLLGRRPASDSDVRLAVGAVLVHAALDLFQAALREPSPFAEHAYELFFQEDCPLDGEEMPSTLAGAVARAGLQGGTALAALVSREAASRLGLRGPSPRLEREVGRHMGRFALIAYETREMLAGQAPPGLMVAPQGLHSPLGRE